jgi:CHAT domain
MRFWIEVNTANGGWDVTVRGEAWSASRRMARVELNDEKGNRAYPCPQECAAAPRPEHQLCVCRDVGTLDDAYGRLVKRSPGGDEVRQFGRYLFNALLGEELWARILTEGGSSDKVELALSWGADEVDLHRLNWELMRAPAGALAGGRVGITRIVRDAEWQARPVPAPPRLLFVVGTDIYDNRIRPGAECFGLMREVEEQSGSWSLYSRVLLDASPSRIKQLAAEFQPDIIHIISHGQVDLLTHKTQLWLQVDPTEKKDDEGQHWRTGEQLLGYFQQAGRLPSLVVLSACDTGVMMGGHQTGVMAAELVKGNPQGGIPVVIGMAGRIADTACRFFTQRFTAALVAGDPLWKAAADGRAAAFAGGADPATSVDWAFPVVYMSAAVQPDYTPVLIGNVLEAKRLESWIGSYDRERDPVFCGRDHCFAAYYDMWKDAAPPVLAIVGEKGYGKTRTLGELAAQAIRDGHVPVLLRGEPPPDMIALCKALSRAVLDTYRAFGLNGPDMTNLLRLGLDPNSLTGEVRKEWIRESMEVNGRVLRRAVMEDMFALTTAVQAAYPLAGNRKREPLLLMDDLQGFDAKILNDLFNDGALDNLGMGRRVNDDNLLLRVIVAFVVNDTAGGILRPVARGTDRTRSWLEVVWLQPFSDKEDEGRVAEDRLVFERVLLHPPRRKVMPATEEERTSYKSLIINPETPKETIEKWMVYLRQAAQGKPACLRRRPGELFWIKVNMAYGLNALIDADFNQLLEQVAKLRFMSDAG